MRNVRSRAALEINRPIVVVNGNHLPRAVPEFSDRGLRAPGQWHGLGAEKLYLWTIDRLM